MAGESAGGQGRDTTTKNWLVGWPRNVFGTGTASPPSRRCKETKRNTERIILCVTLLSLVRTYNLKRRLGHNTPPLDNLNKLERAALVLRRDSSAHTAAKRHRRGKRKGTAGKEERLACHTGYIVPSNQRVEILRLTTSACSRQNRQRHRFPSVGASSHRRGSRHSGT